MNLEYDLCYSISSSTEMYPTKISNESQQSQNKKIIYKFQQFSKKRKMFSIIAYF